MSHPTSKTEQPSAYYNAKKVAELQKKIRELHKYKIEKIPQLEREIQTLKEELNYE